MVDYANIPPSIATCISAKMATLHELDTIYGLEDLWDLLEINAVDVHNQNIMMQQE